MSEESIFSDAVRIDSTQERDAYLEKACGGDRKLLERVRQLLSLSDESKSFLERPPVSLEMGPTVVSQGETHDKGSLAGLNGHSAVADVSLDFLTPSPKSNCLGTIGKYEITGVIGEGGMGLVLRAWDTKLNRSVALKFLAPTLAANANARKRFLREAQAAAAVVHPHIVAIHSIDEGKLPFLDMEYVSGMSLREKIDQQGALDLREILRIGSQIASGLAAAHHQGLIHRDIKPGNILLENGVQRVKITDFGLARAVDDISVTRTGEVSGTPQFMSPEQAHGAKVDQRSDLFSLGSVLYTMCTGRVPFRAETTMGVLKRVCEDMPRPIGELNPDIPEELQAIVERLLEKHPDDRIQSAQEVADILSQYLAYVQQPSEASMPALPYPSRLTANHWWKWTRTVGMGVGGIVLFALLLVGLTTVFGFMLYHGLILEPFNRNLRDLAEAESATTLPTELLAIPEETLEAVPASSSGLPFPDDAPPLARLPFDPAVATELQEQWAGYLGVPVEYTNSIGMKFRLIPPGEFMMGETSENIAKALKRIPDDLYWRFVVNSSGPSHRVRITKPFFMATTEVTFSQFRRFVEESRYQTTGERLYPNDRNWRKLGESSPPEAPAGYLTAPDCRVLCKWLSNAEGLEYELPTEAQWEFACRGGSNMRWCYGDDPNLLDQYAHYGKKLETSASIVAQKLPNAFGLYDMHGNVSEWCRDWHQQNFYRIGPVDDPFCSDNWKTADVRSQTLRGGTWMNAAELVSSACPRHYSPEINYSYPDHGFRPVIIGDLKLLTREKPEGQETPQAPDAPPAPPPPPTPEASEVPVPAQEPEINLTVLTIGGAP